MPDFDLTVVGSGPGGYVAAIHAARLGARVAILEQKGHKVITIQPHYTVASLVRVLTVNRIGRDIADTRLHESVVHTTAEVKSA